MLTRLLSARGSALKSASPAFALRKTSGWFGRSSFSGDYRLTAGSLRRFQADTDTSYVPLVARGRAERPTVRASGRTRISEYPEHDPGRRRVLLPTAVDVACSHPANSGNLPTTEGCIEIATGCRT